MRVENRVRGLGRGHAATGDSGAGGAGGGVRGSLPPVQVPSPAVDRTAPACADGGRTRRCSRPGPHVGFS
jgi:hypothetical protein